MRRINLSKKINFECALHDVVEIRNNKILEVLTEEAITIDDYIVVNHGLFEVISIQIYFCDIRKVVYARLLRIE